MLFRYTPDEREHLRKLNKGIAMCKEVLESKNLNDATPNLNKRVAYDLLMKQLNEKKGFIAEHKVKAKALRKKKVRDFLSKLKFWR